MNRPTVRHNGSEAGRAFVEGFMRHWEEREAKKEAWIEELRACGVKAARPDDGWVDRENDIIRGPDCYPDFNDGAEVGDLVALGTFDDYRLVRVTEIRQWWPFPEYYEWHYERVTCT